VTAEGSKFSMKFFALLLLPCIAYAPAVRQDNPSALQSPRAVVEDATLCDLTANPKDYYQKVVRIRAVFRRAGEDHMGVECADCREYVRPDFEDSFESCTKPGVLKKFRGKRFEVSIAATLIGKLDYSTTPEGKPFGFWFRIMCAEKAEIVGRGDSGDIYRPEVKRKVNCKPAI